jgi:hypothetical protein
MRQNLRNEAGVRLARTASAALPRGEAAAVDQPLPGHLELRFITVRLSTGELEVLVTTLLDEAAYPTGKFAALYHLRWSVETCYLMLKSRLDLKNWSGLTMRSRARIWRRRCCCSIWKAC